MADRTVSARLRADVTRYIAAMRAAEAATRRLADEAERFGWRSGAAFEETNRSAGRLERQIRRLMETQREQSEQTRRGREETDRNTQSQDRFRRSTESATRGMTANRSTLVSLIAAAGAMAPAVVSATVAFGAFGVVAAPSIYKVVTAQEDLAAQWVTLSRGQRTSALLVRGLADDYKALAKSYEPQALAAFNTVVGTTRALLPRLGEVVDATGGDVQRLLNRFAAFTEERVGGEFLDWAGKEAPQALDVLGTTAVTAGDTVLDLVQDLEPLAISMLQLTNGALGLVNGLANLNPGLAQLAITAVLLRAPLAGVVNGVGSMAGRMRAAGGAASGLSRSARLLNLVTAAGPNLYVAAGIGLGFIAFKALSAKSSTDKLIDSLKASYRATGNNVTGYQALINALSPRLAVATQQITRLNAQATESGHITRDWSSGNVAAAGEVSRAQAQMARAIDDANASIQRVNSGADQLAARYHITRDAAIRLATAAGVDLSASIDKSGRLTAAAAVKVEQYKRAVEQANSPTWQINEAFKILGDRTSTLEQRTKALTAAYSAELGPSLALFDANIRLRSGYADLSTQLTNTKARMDGNNAASRALQTAFKGQVDTVWSLYRANVEKNKTTTAGTAEVKRQLPVLYALTQGNKFARAQVDALARSTGNATGASNISRAAFLRTAASMSIARDRAEKLWREFAKIRSKDISLGINAKGSWAFGVDPSKIRSRHATGGPVPLVSGSTPGRDSVAALLTPEEHVWTTREVSAAGGHQAMYRLRKAALAGDLRGYASGGPVTMTSPRVSGQQVADRVLRPIEIGTGELAARIARSMAAEWKKYVGSGGPVVAAARSQIGVPYSWGGGGKGGPSYGIGRGAGTIGFDCSGLTEYAWWQGRRVSIGGVTYTQHPASRPISEWRPGMLLFNRSLGHVALGSNRPGYVIEAPYTGARVREVRRSLPDWRWPIAAGYAAGGPVTALGERAVAAGARLDQLLAAKTLGLAGDPGGLGLPGYQTGGWVTGRAGLAHAGEYVVNARSARLYGPLVEAINTGRPMIATGAGLPRGGPQTIDRHTEINVARMEVRDGVDLDLLAGRIAFHTWASSFGEN